MEAVSGAEKGEKLADGVVVVARRPKAPRSLQRARAGHFRQAPSGFWRCMERPGLELEHREREGKILRPDDDQVAAVEVVAMAEEV